MKVLFIKNFKENLSASLGIASISASLKEDGHQTYLCDADIMEASSLIAALKPDIVAYSVMTTNFYQYLIINQKLKQKYNFMSIFGGPHPTFFCRSIVSSLTFHDSSRRMTRPVTLFCAGVRWNGLC